MGKSRLSPTKQRQNKKKIFGFDIETYSKKNHFLCATVYEDDDNIHFFREVEQLINFFNTKRFRSSYVAATNLAFDFFGTYTTPEHQSKFMTLFAGSDLMYAKRKIPNRKETITFIDTYNYSKMSVAKMGKIINEPKLDKPKCLGKIPKNVKEWEEIKTYNIQDAKVSKLFTEFLFDGFYKLGATPQMTIASTAMSLFRNKYLKETYYPHPEKTTEEMFDGYYGGRTEAFKRGKIVNHSLYDVNSLYPHVMDKHHYPDPASLRTSLSNTTSWIKKYEGMSKVTVKTPDNIKHPLLPYRTKTKLVFPTGTFTSWQSHCELRKAISLGYHISKVHKTYYYKKTCRPFKEYVNDIYKLKKQYTKENNPMVIITKLLLNSLYGKFGQKFMERDNYLPQEQLTMEMVNQATCIEKIQSFVKIKQRTKMPNFCFPIWALYITSYARMHIYDLIVEGDAAYTDTDSIITTKEMVTGDELGELKKENHITSGIIVRPKFYGLIDEDNKEKIRVKGIGCMLNMEMFRSLVNGNSITYSKFMKFKESIRRGFKPGEIVEITKTLSVEDSKREWAAPFSDSILQESMPIKLVDGLDRHELLKAKMQYKEIIENNVKQDLKELIDSDLFDIYSVGVDITPEEFLKNEMDAAIWD